MDKELLEKLHESGSMFLLLVSLISSDTLTDLEACEESKKTREEILHYLIEIQKLTKKEACDFLEFISDPQNYQFLADVNAKIHEAQMIRNISK